MRSATKKAVKMSATKPEISSPTMFHHKWPPLVAENFPHRHLFAREVTICEVDIVELPKVSSKSLWKVWPLILGF